jgi:HEAT repeat protein
MSQCEGALALGRMRVQDEVRRLESMMDNSRYQSVQNCAASALVSLGETQLAMHAYRRWISEEDRDLQRSAIMGFGKIGPAAADEALPHLTEALKSPQMDLRFLAVDSLSKMGPAATPLLQVAAGDSDARVRTRATQALNNRR